MKIIYFDALTNDDYDKIIAYLLSKNVTIHDRNKPDLTIRAEVPEQLPAEMLKEVTFDELITYGDKSLQDTEITDSKRSEA